MGKFTSSVIVHSFIRRRLDQVPNLDTEVCGDCAQRPQTRGPVLHLRDRRSPNACIDREGIEAERVLPGVVTDPECRSVRLDPQLLIGSRHAGSIARQLPAEQSSNIG